MNQVDHAAQRVGIRVGHDAPAKVENVTGKALGVTEDVADLGVKHLGRGEQGGRVQISLHGLVRADDRRCPAQWRAPVHADDVGARFGHGAQQMPCAHPEMDPRHVEISEAGEDSSGGGKHVTAVVGLGQCTHP